MLLLKVIYRDSTIGTLLTMMMTHFLKRQLSRRRTLLINIAEIAYSSCLLRYNPIDSSEKLTKGARRYPYSKHSNNMDTIAPEVWIKMSQKERRVLMENGINLSHIHPYLRVATPFQGWEEIQRVYTLEQQQRHHKGQHQMQKLPAQRKKHTLLIRHMDDDDDDYYEDKDIEDMIEYFTKDL